MAVSNLGDIFRNPALVSAFFAWSLAQLLKFPFYRLIDKRWDWTRIFGAGGMPSSHSSSICAVLMACGLMEGFGSSLFALAFVMAAIVMNDAAGVRRAAGKHATLLNEIVQTLMEDKPLTDEKLKEWIGHTPFEVSMGAILGLIVGGVVVTLMTR